MGRRNDINEGAMNTILVISIAVGVLSWSVWAFILTVIILVMLMTSMGIIR
jgi:hypothetical protein